VIDVPGLLRDVKPWPRRHRRYNQRDLARALRAAAAAGLTVRSIRPDGEIVIGSPSSPESSEQENPWAAFRHG
jgi:hypothetical protein